MKSNSSDAAERQAAAVHFNWKRLGRGGLERKVLKRKGW
jgi:hypothetical protein